MTITTIIPVHNGEGFLAEAIHSVLDQTLPPNEVVVVDDGSNDASAAIARAFGSPVAVLSQSNLGPAMARNLGIAQASSDLLAFLDADDLWMPDKLACQFHALEMDPGCEAVLGRFENFISPELDQYEAARLAKTAAQSGDFHIGALLIRRDAFLRVGCFDIRLRHGDFIDWWSRASHLPLAYRVLPQLVLRRRLHANNLTRREQDGRREYLTSLRQHLARQRATASSSMETPCIETP